MTVETDIFVTLRDLVGNRVFEDFAPFGTTFPFIVHEQAGGDALHFLDGSLPDKKNSRVQVCVYSREKTTRTSIALQVESAMAASTLFQSSAIHAPISDYASDVMIYSSTQNFSVFSTR